MFDDQNSDRVEKLSERKSSIGAHVGGKALDLDDVLTDELGQFGWFQIRSCLLIAVPIIICGLVADYIFSAAAIPHRCRIPECGEYGKLQEFEPEWLQYAVPVTSSGYASCERHAARGLANGTLQSECHADLFDQSTTVRCEGFVYARDNTVVYDFDLGCNEWLRTLAGTLYNLGMLLALPITGYFSDRYGRRVAIVVNAFNLSVLGFVRAFSVNYTMFLAVQIVQTTIGAGVYSSSYIIIAELVGPKYRVLVSVFSTALFALGEMLLGSASWLISPWRYLIVAIHIPCLFIISYYWIMPESVRWLLAKQKYTEAEKLLNNIARLNKTYISEKSLEALTNPPPVSDNITRTGLLRSIIQSPALLRRVCTTPFWWLTLTFVYYGLSINSTSLSDTMHLNYILTSAIAIPGFLIPVLLLDRVGRRAILSMGFFSSAICNIVFVFIPSELTILRLIIYLLGKFCISMVGTTAYLYTSELYPTEFRHTLLAFSSMVGRIGSVAAPLTPALMIYWHGIPSLSFGLMGLVAGLLALTQPETMGCRMPDTLAEAEAIGVSKTKATC